MSSRGQVRFQEPPLWTAEELEVERLQAEDNFRVERMEEPLEEYLVHFESVQGLLEDLIEATIDLQQLDQQAMAILSNSEMLDGLRYLTGPPISEDDLKTLIQSNSLIPRTFANKPELVNRLLEVIHAGLDRRRFPWISENRDPTPSERDAAILSSAAIMATRRTETARRNSGKEKQEQRVQDALLANGFIEVPRRPVGTLGDAPGPGEFCREAPLGDRKADMVVGLWDGRILGIECKVSNSSTNSVKRLNNDAAVKAGYWIKEFGTRQVVPMAVLSGVYKLHNLEQAQSRGLTIIWAHRLSDLTEWINSTQ